MSIGSAGLYRPATAGCTKAASRVSAPAIEPTHRMNKSSHTTLQKGMDLRRHVSAAAEVRKKCQRRVNQSPGQPPPAQEQGEHCIGQAPNQAALAAAEQHDARWAAQGDKYQ